MATGAFEKIFFFRLTFRTSVFFSGKGSLVETSHCGLKLTYLKLTKKSTRFNLGLTQILFEGGSNQFIVENDCRTKRISVLIARQLKLMCFESVKSQLDHG